MPLQCVHLDHPQYPQSLKHGLGVHAPASIGVIGALGVFQGKLLGLICSISCPGSVILKTYDAIREFRDAGVTLIGGFHSPMEKECLTLLLRGTQPVIVCPARSIDGMRLPTEWKKPIAEGRLLVLSPFTNRSRITAELAEDRNLFVSALANAVLVPHAAPGGKTEMLCSRLLGQKKRIYTVPDHENLHLLEAGVARFDVAAMIAEFGSADRSVS